MLKQTYAASEVNLYLRFLTKNRSRIVGKIPLQVSTIISGKFAAVRFDRLGSFNVNLLVTQNC